MTNHKKWCMAEAMRPGPCSCGAQTVFPTGGGGNSAGVSTYIDLQSEQIAALTAQLAEAEREINSVNFDKSRLLDERQVFLKGLDDLRAQLAESKTLCERHIIYRHSEGYRRCCIPGCKTLVLAREAAEKRLAELREAVRGITESLDNAGNKRPDVYLRDQALALEEALDKSAGS